MMKIGLKNKVLLPTKNCAKKPVIVNIFYALRAKNIRITAQMLDF